RAPFMTYTPEDPQPGVMPMVRDERIVAAEPCDSDEPRLASRVAPEELDGLTNRLLDRLSASLDLAQLRELSEERREQEVRRVIDHLLGAEPLWLDQAGEEVVKQTLLDELLGLGPIEPLLRDPNISEIMVNGPTQVFVETDGRLAEVRSRFRNADHL